MRTMMRVGVGILSLFIVSVVVMNQPAAAAESKSALVDVQWLEKNQARADLLLIDASSAQKYATQHIAGAVNADVFSYGAEEVPAAEMEKRIQSWGVSRGKTVVVYDAGGTFLATRLFFTLAYYGFPVEKLAVLDGGLAKWQASGLPVTKDAAVVSKGSFRVGAPNENLRVRLPEVLTGSGDPAGVALVDALGPDWHYGQTAPFDRAGHIPNSVLLPATDFFNADKTFKPAAEIRSMLALVGVRKDQQIYSYCGGGVAASVPFFAIRYIAGYPNVELFVESELGWLKDTRELPFWTYDAPLLMRRSGWLRAWNGKMLRMYGVSNISIVDVRPKEAFDEGHIPFALNVPAGVFASNVATPEKLAPILASAGVNPSSEAVIVSGGGVTKEAALAYAMLEKLGQKNVSIFVDSLESAAQSGIALTKDPTIVGAKKSPGDAAIVPVAYPANLRAGVILADAGAASGVYPRVFLASGSALPSRPPAGTVIQLPHTGLLDGGAPKAAKDIWDILSKGGVPRYAEVVCIADDPAEAAANYFVLKLMGWPDVKMMSLPAAEKVAESR